MQNSFSYERFPTEAQENSEMAYRLLYKNGNWSSKTISHIEKPNEKIWDVS